MPVLNRYAIYGIGKHVEGYSNDWVDALKSTGINLGNEEFKEIVWDQITEDVVKKDRLEALEFFDKKEIVDKI
ncbi:hypothetical protein KAW65_04085 [candidate division WOR-3 bacterium]|nr:hypothetical protein [candidate division WOR-3 bacterium]